MNAHRMHLGAGALAFIPLLALAVGQAPTELTRVGFDQHLDAKLPLATRFIDEGGASAPLSSYFGLRPVVLLLGYNQCPNLCSAVRESLTASLRAIDLTAGEDYDVLAVSIDPRDREAIMARQAQRAPPDTPPRPAPVRGWHFLSGGEGAIARLTDTVGFRYAFDPVQRQFAHPAGIVIVTPEGSVARYFFGVDFPPDALRQGIVDAGAGRIAAPIRSLLLLCLHYDPATGRFSATVETAARAVGLCTAVALLGLVVIVQRRRRSPRSRP